MVKRRKNINVSKEERIHLYRKTERKINVSNNFKSMNTPQKIKEEEKEFVTLLS